jgi:hypothetical protein
MGDWTEFVADPSTPWIVTFASAAGETVVVDYHDWERLTPEGGESYWWNAKKGESAWLRPGWNLVVAADGTKFYSNSTTGATAVEQPPLYVVRI